jgi:hypothetical protein
LKDGELTVSSRRDLRETMEVIRGAVAAPTIAIHFHGGLVDQETARQAAERLAPEYAASGATPIFVIWQTGLLETLKNNWKDVFSKEFFEGILERVLQFLVGKTEQPSGAKTGTIQLPHPDEVRDEIAKRDKGIEPYGNLDPDNLDENLSKAEKLQFEKAIQKDAGLTKSANDVLKQADEQQFEREFRDTIREQRTAASTGAKSVAVTLATGVAVKALMGALRRFNRGRGHGLYPTAVEEVAKAIFAADVFGRFAWNSMKKDAKDAFGEGDDRYGGSALLSEIERLWADGVRPRLVLVGHSAGSIFACEMLMAAAKRKLSAAIKFEVVLLAPACTFALFDNMLTLAPDRIAGFRCFAMSEKFEQKDEVLGKVYPRSLLYLVSGALEETADEPILGMQRFHSRQPPFHDEKFPGSCPSQAPSGLSPRFECNKRKSDGVLVVYQPNARYIGPDWITVEVINPSDIRSSGVT